MKLLPEFQKVVDNMIDRWAIGHMNSEKAIREAVTRCQELALRVPEMSDAEIDGARAGQGWNSKGAPRDGEHRFARAVLAAYESKRFQPIKRVVRCRLFKDGNKVVCATDDDCKVLDSPEWEWLGDIFEREI